MPLWKIAAVCGAVLLATVARGENAAVRQQLRLDIEHLVRTERFEVAGELIVARDDVVNFYTRRDFEPVWIDDSSAQANLELLISEMADLGLNPADYHQAQLKPLTLRLKTDELPSPRDRADYELLATDAAITLAHHRVSGKVDLADRGGAWQIDPGRFSQPVDEVLERVLQRANLLEAVRSLETQAFYYQQLKAALARYQAIAANGGWPPIPERGTWRRGDRGSGVGELRRLLAVTGDLEVAGDLNDPVFDATLEEAVRRFQRRHLLQADGVVGAGTVAAMNVPVEVRIDQLRVNLERARWFGHDQPALAVVVNIAARQAYVVSEGRRVWSAPATVGPDYRQTPTFKASISAVQVNPAWIVPPDALRRDVLPALLRSPSVLGRYDLELIDRDAQPVDPAGVEWSRYSVQDWPYGIRQRPGPRNPMGRVALVAPNPAFVVVHGIAADAPRSGMLANAGSVGVERALEMVQLLLEPSGQWDAGEAAALIDSGETRSVFLREPVPLYVTYWTAEMTEDGQVLFWPDSYERDPAILERLDQPYSLGGEG